MIFSLFIDKISRMLIRYVMFCVYNIYLYVYTINTRSNHCSIRSLIRFFFPVAHVYYIERHEIPIPNRNDITYDISKSILCAILHVYLYIHVSDHALKNVIYLVVVKVAMAKATPKTNNKKKTNSNQQHIKTEIKLKMENYILSEANNHNMNIGTQKMKTIKWCRAFNIVWNISDMKSFMNDLIFFHRPHLFAVAHFTWKGVNFN